MSLYTLQRVPNTFIQSGCVESNMFSDVMRCCTLVHYLLDDAKNCVCFLFWFTFWFPINAFFGWKNNWWSTFMTYQRCYSIKFWIKCFVLLWNLSTELTLHALKSTDKKKIKNEKLLYNLHTCVTSFGERKKQNKNNGTWRCSGETNPIGIQGKSPNFFFFKTFLTFARNEVLSFVLPFFES